MINWQKGTWEAGDKAKYHDMLPNQKPQYYEVHAGLYWYSGLGSGTFFRPDGTMMLNCSPQEAHGEAVRLGIEYRYVDSFCNIGRATYVGD
jgi:hypothetical protein